MVQGLPGVTKLLETVDEQEIDNVLNEQSDSEIERECQNDTELSYLDYNFKC